MALFVITLAVFAGAVSADPDMLQDICVADLTSSTLLLSHFISTYLFSSVFNWGRHRSRRAIFPRTAAGEAQYEKAPTPHHHIFLLGGLGF